MTNQFAKTAFKGLSQCFEYAVFAENIPMSNKEREEIKKHIYAIQDILKKY